METILKLAKVFTDNTVATQFLSILFPGTFKFQAPACQGFLGKFRILDSILIHNFLVSNLMVRLSVRTENLIPGKIWTIQILQMPTIEWLLYYSICNS